MTQIEIKKAVKWFYYSQIRQRYISQTPQKLDKDIGIIVKEENPFDKLLNLIDLERNLVINENEFEGIDIRHPLWGLMKWYFKSQNAICLSTGINIRKNMGKNYDLEWDHIFPYSVLKENGYDINNRIKYSYAQEITNRSVLTQISNRTKSAMMAEGYLSDALEKFPESLKLQCIPEDKDLWKLENYEKFLKKRRSTLAKELNSYLQNITETTDDEAKLDLVEMIQAGENHSVEFKTTLRYDVKTGSTNKTLEQVVIKTIAAFSNGQGGTLIMGVNDDMEVVGLENDYNTFKDATKDDFELHLRNLINKAYGIKFTATNLNVTFPEIEDKKICVVEIKSGGEPLYTMVTDKNGGKSEKFYLRSGNSSQELKLSEVSSYISERFGK